MSDLIGTVWAKTRAGRTTYVRVTDHGPSNAFVAECTEKGALLFTLGRGYTTRQVQLSHEGTRVKGRRRVEVQA
jgi:hypothetical protein